MREVSEFTAPASCHVLDRSRGGHGCVVCLTCSLIKIGNASKGVAPLVLYVYVLCIVWAHVHRCHLTPLHQYTLSEERMHAQLAAHTHLRHEVMMRKKLKMQAWGGR